jgi:hypothetical protein
MLVAATLITQIEPWLIISAGLVGVAWINKRGQTGAALEYSQSANKLLHDQNSELKKERTKLIAEVVALRSKTDLSLAVIPLSEQLQAHETRAEDRHKKTVMVLDLIAERLGADPEKIHAAGSDV